MMQSTHTPQHLRTRTFLLGHGRGTRSRSNATLPGIDANERRARRAVWMRGQSDRQEQSTRTGRVAFAGALLALLLTVAMAMTTPKAASQALSIRTPEAVEVTDVPVQLADASRLSPAQRG